MSLRWSIEGVADYEQLLDDDNQAITQAIALQSMHVGLSGITEKNVKEFATRVIVLEKVWGPILRNGDQKVALTYDDIHRRIGMTVNVSPITNAQFDKRLISHLRDSATRQIPNNDTRQIPNND